MLLVLPFTSVVNDAQRLMFDDCRREIPMPPRSGARHRRRCYSAPGGERAGWSLPLLLLRVIENCYSLMMPFAGYAVRVAATMRCARCRIDSGRAQRRAFILTPDAATIATRADGIDDIARAAARQRARGGTRRYAQRAVD